MNQHSSLAVFRDTTNIHSKASATALMTPSSAHTFGIPNPTSSKRRALSSVSYDSVDSSRHLRYSREEDALKSALQSCTAEPTDRELQIRAIEKAIALLKTHAIDAQERAKRLRAVLSDRDLEPETYQSLQRERWIEEHRSKARSDESKALLEMVTKLKASTGSLIDPPVTTGSKLYANLSQFFSYSPTRVSLSSSSRRIWDDSIFRHRTISDVRSLRLRSTAATSALSSPVGRRIRSKSMGRKYAAPDNRSVDTPYTRGAGRFKELSGGTMPRAATTTMSAQVTSPAALLFQDAGVATIFTSATPRSREELTAEVEHVELPSYAQDLMDEFDDIDGDITLPNLPSQSSTRAQPVPVGQPPSLPLPTLTPKTSHTWSARHERSSSLPRTSLGDTIRVKPDPHFPMRKPISMLFPKATKDSLDSDSRPGSSLADNDVGDGSQMPVGSVKNRWSMTSTSMKSPSKVFSRVKNRFSKLGRK
ncbi:unnamed protein product [Somion occarium]